jgi:hypothetical protein
MRHCGRQQLDIRLPAFETRHGLPGARWTQEKTIGPESNVWTEGNTRSGQERGTANKQLELT